MLLFDENGQPFAVGANRFGWFLPNQPELLRIVVEAEVDGLPVQAIVDTGAPYLILHPEIASALGIDARFAVGTDSLIIRGQRYGGRLHRLPLTFIGLTGVLERIRFAVDPGSELFYFGPLA